MGVCVAVGKGWGYMVREHSYSAKPFSIYHELVDSRKDFLITTNTKIIISKKEIHDVYWHNIINVVQQDISFMSVTWAMEKIMICSFNGTTSTIWIVNHSQVETQVTLQFATSHS